MNELDRTADYALIVTVRVYGPGSAEDAAQALMDYQSTFDLPRDAEVEILDARPMPPPGHNHPPGTDHPEGIHGCAACAREVARFPEKISGEDPYREYQDALADHARASGLDRERTKRLVDRAWDAYQRTVK